MMLIELFAPKGALSDADRSRLSERLVTEVMTAEGMSADVLERARAMSWLVIHEPEVWTVGGESTDQLDGPRYVVRVNVPDGHLSDAMRAELVRRVTRVLAENDDDPQRLYQEPHAWVHIVELSDGNAGAFGQVMHTSDIMKLVVNGIVPEGDDHVVEEAVDTVVDPICGMSVALTADAITLEHEGVTYGFCGSMCRDMFIEQQAGESAQ
jgi:YHS domain-containing protein/phenylpyruvate tautomerase PptA (4-oxalocrotonate tautomerase family)